MEIFQHITSFLAPSDSTCLSLTCTGLWSLVAENTIQAFAQKDAYWLGQRTELLLNLAKDSADMIICDACLKLHQLHYGRALTVSNQWIRPTCHHLASYVSICQHFSVTLEMLELVLKLQDNLECTSARSPDPLGHTCTWRTSGSGSAEVALSVTSKVFERELYLRLVYDVDIKLNVRKNFSVPSMRGKGCLHAGMWLKRKCACALQHAMMSEFPCASCFKAQRCRYCLTHFVVSANKTSGSNLHLQVRAYRYLGGGRAGGASSKHAWIAQQRPFSIAKQEQLRFHNNGFSLEDIFEQNDRKHFLSGYTFGSRRTDATGFPTAYVAFFKKLRGHHLGTGISNGME